MSSHIVICVAAQQAGVLTEADVRRGMEVCAGRDLRWLQPGVAAEFGAGAPADAGQVKMMLQNKAVDVFVTRARGRRKAVLLADMDSTIITTETLDELAGFAGLGEKIAAITARSMNGEIDFATALRERVAMLRGLDLSALEETWKATKFCPGAKTLVATMKHFGATTALVSGGFTYFTSRVAEAVGFDQHRANVLLDDGAQLTGEVGEPILDRDAKLAALTEIAAQRGVKLSATAAVGDGANDLGMIQAAGLGVAYYAKPVVAAQVGNRIEFTDLRSILFVQGYKSDVFQNGEDL